MATTKLAHEQPLIGDTCFAPTVLAGVTPEMRVYSEEPVGPLLAVVAVDGPDEAVSVANDTEYVTVQAPAREYPI